MATQNRHEVGEVKVAFGVVKQCALLVAEQLGSTGIVTLHVNAARMGSRFAVSLIRECRGNPPNGCNIAPAYSDDASPSRRHLLSTGNEVLHH